MTSLAREHGAEQDLDAFAATLQGELADAFDRATVEVSAEELAARAEQGAVTTE